MELLWAWRHLEETYPLTAKQTPHELLPKLFGPLRERYADRPGGYTRVLRVEPKEDDQAPSAILELVDGPKDMRFAMTARTLARLQKEDKEINDITAKNIDKVTRFRKGGETALEELVKKMSKMEFLKRDRDVMEKKWAQKP
jgi:large subunit ribosomal protein L17